jgi:hypothetical protein
LGQRSSESMPDPSWENRLLDNLRLIETSRTEAPKPACSCQMWRITSILGTKSGITMTSKLKFRLFCSLAGVGCDHDWRGPLAVWIPSQTAHPYKLSGEYLLALALLRAPPALRVISKEVTWVGPSLLRVILQTSLYLNTSYLSLLHGSLVKCLVVLLTILVNASSKLSPRGCSCQCLPLFGFVVSLHA